MGKEEGRGGPESGAGSGEAEKRSQRSNAGTRPAVIQGSCHGSELDLPTRRGGVGLPSSDWQKAMTRLGRDPAVMPDTAVHQTPSDQIHPSSAPAVTSPSGLGRRNPGRRGEGEPKTYHEAHGRIPLCIAEHRTQEGCNAMPERNRMLSREGFATEMRRGGDEGNPDEKSCELNKHAAELQRRTRSAKGRKST